MLQRATSESRGRNYGSIALIHPIDGWSVVGIPIVEKPTLYGSVVQLVRMPACHAGGRGIVTHRSRQISDT